jgi:hypothetical protein
MASTDPSPAHDGAGPVLYMSGSSFACQFTRLVLAEKDVPYRLRSVNLSALEQVRWRGLGSEGGRGFGGPFFSQ